MDLFTLSQLDPGHHKKVATAIKAAETWYERRKGGNLLSSLILVSAAVEGSPNVTGYGTGKTHIARACFHTDLYYAQDHKGNWIPHCAAGKFYEADKLIQAADPHFPLDIRPGQILVIDDVGTEAKIEYIAAADQKQEIVNRYTKIIDFCYTKRERQRDGSTLHGVSVIMTSNLPVPELIEHIGGRAWSRLQQMAGPGCICDMTGVSDYRVKLRKGSNER